MPLPQFDLLTRELQQLGRARLAELRNKWQDDITSEQEITFCYLFGLSDFIFQSCLRYQSIWQNLLPYTQLPEQDPLPDFPYNEQAYLAFDESQILRELRVYRHWTMSILAARDFLKQSTIVGTMKELSLLADRFYLIARRWAEHQLSARWGQAVSSEGTKIELIALGMGKLGGLELNFSSDIDLIFCYAQKGTTQGGRRSEDFQIYFTKLAQKIIQLLDSNTPDGRVFRVDMRLRPFGDSGPLVSSFDAIEDYYQEQGREWERYALLKARPLGQSLEISQEENNQQIELINALRPFVYRRYIDFSVIESLRGMKNLIQQEVKRRKLNWNIKLGEGGIREVEFIVQAMQMLRGGKEPQLQQPSLLNVLPELVQLNVFTDGEQQQLKRNYLWLRQCEQYLQAFADQQTQTLPHDHIEQLRLCHLFEVTSWQQLLDKVQQVQQSIHHLFTEIIGSDAPQQQQTDPLEEKWKGVWLLEEPNEHNFSEVVLTQRRELSKSVSGSRGRDKLDQLIPQLLAESERQSLNDKQLKEVLAVIRKIASRTTYLELLVENKGATSQLIKLVSSCHFIGQQLSKFPLLLDQLIDPKLLYSIPQITSYQDELRRHLLRVEPDDLEQQMEVLRQYKLASQLIIAACDVENVATLMQVSDHLTALAEACLQQAVNLAWQQMVARYGYPEGADANNKNFAVIGYGKLGGYELGYGSDLDIVFVHGCNSSKATDGNKAIDSRQFYIKLAQRVMHIFTTRTLSGELYEIDTRLRPSGASGLLAINIDTFADYQQTEAWTWEHQALVRSRFILGEEQLSLAFNRIRQQVLAKQRDETALRKDISDMRQKMFDNLAKETEASFDLKQSRGGIADIEFISQYLVLANCHRYPELAQFPDNLRILETAQQVDLISIKDRDQLVSAYIAFRDYYHIASLNGEQKVVDQNRVTTHKQNVLDIWQSLQLT